MPTGHPSCLGKGAECSCQQWALLEFTAPVLSAVVLQHCGGLHNRPGTGEGADFNPKLPSPHPGEQWNMHSPQLTVNLHCGLHELKEHLSLSAKKFQASRCRPGLSLQQGVLHSGCFLKLWYSSAAPLGGLDTSEVKSLHWMGGRCTVFKTCRKVLHQSHAHCLSCSIYHRMGLAAASKHLSWSLVTEAMLKPSRSQSITKTTQGHVVGRPPTCGHQANKSCLILAYSPWPPFWG